MLLNNVVKFFHLPDNIIVYLAVALIVSGVYTAIFKFLFKKKYLKETSLFSGIVCLMITCFLGYQVVFSQEWPLLLFVLIFLLLAIYYFRKCYLEAKKVRN